MLGTRPDREVGKLIGRSLVAVQGKWLILGIPSWKAKTARERGPVDPEKAKLLYGPYACLGKLSIAKELLEKARRCASDVRKSDRLFCVKTYTNVTVEECLAANDEMLSPVNENKLWDGTALSSALSV